MNIQFTTIRGECCEGVLEFAREGDTSAHIVHYNTDDDHYKYHYTVTGTVDEINTLETFCNFFTALNRRL
jgi:hypothetical protein